MKPPLRPYRGPPAIDSVNQYDLGRTSYHESLTQPVNRFNPGRTSYHESLTQPVKGFHLGGTSYHKSPTQFVNGFDLGRTSYHQSLTPRTGKQRASAGQCNQNKGSSRVRSQATRKSPKRNAKFGAGSGAIH